MTRRQWPPALMTMLTLSSGFAALQAAATGHWLAAALFVMLAAVADGMDGTIARALHGVCDMGAQLDSLADVVAFGVAPAFIFLARTPDLPPGIRYGVALLFVLSGAYRLARFHTLPADGTFLGVPITAAGTLMACATAGPLGTDSWLCAAMGVVLAGFMVCRVTFPKLVPSRQGLAPVLIVFVLALVLRRRAETLPELATIAFTAYIVWGVIRRIVGGPQGDAFGLAVDELSRPL